MSRFEHLNCRSRREEALGDRRSAIDDRRLRSPNRLASAPTRFVERLDAKPIGAPWDHEPGRLVGCSRFSVFGHPDTLKGGHRTGWFMEGCHDSSNAHRGHGPGRVSSNARASWSAAVLCRFRRVESARGLAQSKTWRQARRSMGSRLVGCPRFSVLGHPNTLKGGHRTGWFMGRNRGKALAVFEPLMRWRRLIGAPASGAPDRTLARSH
jgi:hypothetical protein